MKRGRVMVKERKGIHLLIPVLLILAAGFLASQQHFPSLIKQLPYTGKAVVDIASCSPDDILFQASAKANAHIYAAGTSPSTAPYAVCPFPGLGTGAPIDFRCNSVCAADPASPLCNAVLKMSSASNAHAELKTQTNYNQSICFKGVSCSYAVFPNSCAGIGPEYTCLATLSNATNAHIADCANQTYSIAVCCKQVAGMGPLDTDGDGVLDDGDNSGLTTDKPCQTSQTANCDDNCPATPNGPLRGTCKNTNVLCTSDADCGGVVNSCDLVQTDADGDGAGNACDAAPNNACTIALANDNCPGIINCPASSLSASWGSTSVAEGSSVSLTVAGSSQCSALSFQFHITNTQDPSVSPSNPQPAAFASGSASSSWIAEYHPSAQANTYTFQASALVNGSALTVSSANALTVTRNAGATCGNGLIEGSNSEQCDDGNTRNFDGCSSNCTLEGVLGQQCSNECPVNGLGICSSTSSIKLCGNYDNDPCLELSRPLNCQSSTICSSSYGDAGCIPGVCEDAFQCTIGECVDGFKTRSCTNTGSNVCNAYSPAVKIPCSKLESPAQLPVFTFFNLVLSVLLIAGYCAIRRSYKK